MNAIAEITFRVSVPVDITQRDLSAAITCSTAGGPREIFGEVRARALARAADEIARKLREEATRVQDLYAGVER